MNILNGMNHIIIITLQSIILLIIAFFVIKFIFNILKNWWLDESQDKFASNLNYVLLQIYFPRNNEIFPKAMEQVFASLYQVYSFGINLERKWLEGQFEEIMSIETVASKDGIKFFFRINKKSRAILESSILSHYPQSEIQEVSNDYIKELPSNIPNDEYELMGADMILGKNSAYPIKTYSYFFGDRKYEEQEVDPITTLMEAMSNLKNNEKLWVQILIRPAGDKLKNAAKKIIAEKMGKKETPKTNLIISIIRSTIEFIIQVIQAFYKPPESGTSVKTEEKPKSLSAIDNEIIKAIEAKSAKLAFDTIIRIIYIDKKDTFSSNNFKAATSAFQPFGIGYLNFIRPARLTMTVPSRFYVLGKNRILLNKKKQIFQNYINRRFVAYSHLESLFYKCLEPSLLNVEELATIFHPPTIRISAIGLGQSQSKKGAPPPNLPIE